METRNDANGNKGTIRFVAVIGMIIATILFIIWVTPKGSDDPGFYQHGPRGGVTHITSGGNISYHLCKTPNCRGYY